MELFSGSSFKRNLSICGGLDNSLSVCRHICLWIEINQETIESISRSIRNHVFPLLILFSVLLSATASFNSSPSSSADGLMSFMPGVNQSQESSGETISTRSSAQLVSCPLYLFGNCLLFYRIDFDVIKDIFWTISIGKQTEIIYLFILFLFLCWNTSLHVLFYSFFLKTRMSSIFTVF